MVTMIVLKLALVLALVHLTKSQVIDVSTLLLKAPTQFGSERCGKQLAEFQTKFLKEEWALKMVDAWTKFPSGLLMGNIMDLGNFDECIQIDHQFENDHLLGKYCAYSWTLSTSKSMAKERISLSSFKSRANTTMRAEGTKVPLIIGSMCLPDACNPTDLKPLIKSLNLDGVLSVNDGVCQSKEYYQQDFDGYAYFGAVFFSTFIALMVLSTSYDVYLEKTNRKPTHLALVAFSVYSNGRKLLATKRTPGQITCMNGIRVISMMWVILGHMGAGVQSSPYINALEVQQLLKEVRTQFIQGAHLAVDTFLFLTGVLIAYSFIRSQSKPKAKLNLVMFYVHRYLRLTPALLGIFVFVISLMRYCSSGPLWPYYFDYSYKPCIKWWWSVFLYVQNYVNMDEICLIPTWYISMDMQVFILSPLILIPLVKWRKPATYALYALLGISIALPAAISYIYKTQMFTQDYYDYYYYLTHTRMAPYFIGILLGLYFYENENKKVKIHWALNISIWTFVLFGMGTIVFTGADIINNYDRVKTTVYITLHRPLWAAGLGWIVFASMNGYGGIANWFLSLPIFQVLAKLTYSMYLIHEVVLVMVMGTNRVSGYFTLLEMVHIFWGHFVYIAVISLFWVLAFESPIIILEKIIFSCGNKPKDLKKDDNLNDISVETKET